MYTKEERLEEFMMSLNPGGEDGNGGIGNGGFVYIQRKQAHHTVCMSKFQAILTYMSRND